MSGRSWQGLPATPLIASTTVALEPEAGSRSAAETEKAQRYLDRMTKGQEAIRQIHPRGAGHNGQPTALGPALSPIAAPVVFSAPDGERELGMMRWGMPGPPQFSAEPIPANRCLVPVTSFCEYEDTKPRKTPTWFALDQSRPLFFFAGIWTPWFGRRGTKAEPIEGEHMLFQFF